jgi:hypothetical protein
VQISEVGTRKFSFGSPVAGFYWLLAVLPTAKDFNKSRILPHGSVQTDYSGRAEHKKQMPFVAGKDAWPSALSRARSLRSSARNGRPLTGEGGGPGPGFQQEGLFVRSVVSEGS